MKKRLAGYNVLDENGNVIENLVGTQPRKKLDKLRKTNYIRKVFVKK